MARSTVRLTVMDMRPTNFHSEGEDFKVVRIYNTTSVEIGEYLSVKQVDAFLKAWWKIDIIKFDRSK